MNKMKLNFNDTMAIENALNSEVNLPSDWSIEEIFNLKYVNDAKGNDVWQSPRITLQRGAGDCEDLSRVVVGAVKASGGDAKVQTVRVGPRLRHAVCVSKTCLPSPYCWLREEYPFPVDGIPHGRYIYDPSWWGGMPCPPLDEKRRARVRVWSGDNWNSIQGYEIGGTTPQSEVRRLLPIAANLIKGKPAWPWLWAVMYFETGGSFDPSIKNKQNGATGLIQFVASTAKGMGYSLERLGAMSFQEQLLVPVVQYFNRLGKPMNTLTDVAAGVFYPAGIGKPGFIVGRRGQPAYDLNKALDVNGDEVLTIEEYTSRVFVIWKKEFYKPETSFLEAINNAKNVADIKSVFVDIEWRGIVSAAAAQRVREWITSIEKWQGKGWLSFAQIEKEGGFDVKRWAEDKIRGLFALPRDYSPGLNEYVEAVTQTATDLKEVAAETLSTGKIIVPALAVIAGAYAATRLLPRK